jgi:hypothetical protein
MSDRTIEVNQGPDGCGCFAWVLLIWLVFFGGAQIINTALLHWIEKPPTQTVPAEKPVSPAP